MFRSEIISRTLNILLINFQVVNIVTSNQDCVNNIAESMVLSNLLALLHSLPSSAYIHWNFRNNSIVNPLRGAVTQMIQNLWHSVIHVLFWNILSGILYIRFVFLIIFLHKLIILHFSYQKLKEVREIQKQKENNLGFSICWV